MPKSVHFYLVIIGSQPVQNTEFSMHGCIHLRVMMFNASYPMYCGRHGRVCMVVGFTTTYAISACHHSSYEFESRSWRGVLDPKLYDKVGKWLPTGYHILSMTRVKNIKCVHVQLKIQFWNTVSFKVNFLFPLFKIPITLKNAVLIWIFIFCFLIIFFL
jgi:hypothetical protein